MAKVEKTLANGTTQVDKKANKAKNKKQKANKEPKPSKVKETIGELKNVSWPSFGKTMKQTGMVISVVLLFMLVTLGIDSLLTWLLELLTKI